MPATMPRGLSFASLAMKASTTRVPISPANVIASPSSSLLHRPSVGGGCEAIVSVELSMLNTVHKSKIFLEENPKKKKAKKKCHFEISNFGMMCKSVQNDVVLTTLFLHVILNPFAHPSEFIFFKKRCWECGGRVYLSPGEVYTAKYAHLCNPQQSLQ